MPPVEPRPDAGCLDEDAGVAFVEGRLDRAGLAEIERHLDGCAACQDFTAALARLAATAGAAVAPEVRPLAAGDRLGRYTIVRPVGRGATAVVYEAHDPKLDRHVALKLIDSGHGRATELGARLVDEARAMARLSHPNVLSVYDTGAVGETVFIAMELVTGQTLGGWIRERARSSAEIVAAFVAAGRGLAAAHQAGLVHRDFKPDNVLVDRAGRVLVTDFGLARAVLGGAPGASASDLRLTRTGGVVGTPAYMAPEQVDGLGDARSDQFSFCVALYEAVAGARPFAGDRFDEILAAVRAGRIRRPLAPRWLDRAVRRGLAADPTARHASMDALLADLERGLRPARWPWLAVVGAGAIAMIGVTASTALAPSSATLACADSELRLIGVWDPARKARVERAFAATGLGYAADAWREVERSLDRYARGWALRRTEICMAEHDGRWSARLATLSDACFSERLVGLGALVDVLGEADARAVESSIGAAADLGELATCADPARLGPWQETVADPARRDRQRELVRTMSAIRARLETGRYPAAAEALPGAIREAHALELARTEAEAMLLSCRVNVAMRELARGESDCHRAAQLGAGAGAVDLTARAWAMLTGVVGDSGRYPEAERWAEYARAALTQSGGSPTVEAALENAMGIVAKQQGRIDEARAHYQRAVAVYEQIDGADSLAVARALNNLGILEGVAGRHRVALDLHRRALAIREARLGADHPDVATALVNLGLVERAAGDFAAARRSYGRAIALAEASRPLRRTLVANAIYARGILTMHEGRPAEAVPDVERALAITTEIVGAEHPGTATMMDGLGWIRLALGQPAAAAALHRRALAIRSRIFTPDHALVLDSHEKLADALLALGRSREAMAHLRLALAGRRTRGDAMEIAFVLGRIGRAERALGRPAVAEATLLEALALAGEKPADLQIVAEVRLELAEVRWRRGARAAAIALARRAVADAAEAPDGGPTERASRAWLAAHPTATDLRGSRGSRPDRW